MRLPRVRYDMPKYKQSVVQVGGINYSDQTQDGDLADSKNLSTRRFPYICTRRGREKLPGAAYEQATALTAWGKPVSVVGSTLYFDGQAVGSVLPGEKQFVVVNTRLVIWPDKKALNLNDLTLSELGAKVSGAGAVFTDDSITVSWSGVDLSKLFKSGDGIIISGCTAQEKNNLTVTISAVTANTIRTTAEAFTAATETATITLLREIPDMDFICESENRLWGCSSEKQTIYASANGEPENFNVFQGLSTDSYALAISSEGGFTGCCKLGSSVLFWKEGTLHKILGSYPSEYSLYTYTLEGLKEGCHKSLQVINETLFYMGPHGVHAFTGGTPSLISSNFGEREFSEAVAGNDGDSYYLAVREGEAAHLFVYETRHGIWVREDELYCLDFARIGKRLYMLTESGEVYLTDSGKDEPDIEWRAAYTPFRETMEGRKIYPRVLLRVELPKGSHMTVETRSDGGAWQTAGKLVGDEADVKVMPVMANRADCFELRLSGKGPCTILGMLREFAVGSDA